MSIVKKLPVKLTVSLTIAVIIIISAISASIAVKKRLSDAEIKPTTTSPHLSNVSKDEITLAALNTSSDKKLSAGNPSLNESQNIISEDKTPKRSPVKIKGKKTLHLKLLTRPFSKIYDDPYGQKVKFDKVDTFRIYFAYTTPEETPGFYEVGTDARGTTIGFMRQDDVIEWKQYLTLKFTHQEGERTLFFRNSTELEKLMYGKNRIREIQNIRRKIKEISDGFPLEEDFPVVAVEPVDYVNIYGKPYLLPILKAVEQNWEGKDIQILHVASAVKDERKPTAGNNKLQLEGAFKPSQDTELISDFKLDVVFVIDTTISMQPYIDGTTRAIQQMATAISTVSEDVNFGLVAYRDDPGKVPALAYKTKIFCNLQEGKDINTFIQKARSVKAATVSSIGFDEEVWAGIYEAMKDRQNLKRRDDAVLFIVQIGDAGAHDYPGTVFNPESISRLAENAYDRRDSRIWIFSIHLWTPEAKKANNISKAKWQFQRVVSKLPGKQFYYPIKDGSIAEFERRVKELIEALMQMIKSTNEGKVPVANYRDSVAEGGTESDIKLAVKAAIRAAVLEYVGTKKTASGDVTPPPRDIKAWTIDRDLEDPKIKPMSVMLMITRNDLDKLRKSMQILMKAALTSEVTSDGFFDQLQSIMTSAIREPEMISKGIKPGNLTLGKAGILPEFIKDLPYATNIIDMPITDWREMRAGEQTEFIEYVRSSLALYEEYYKDSDKWIELNKGDREGDHVTFINIKHLP